MGPLPRIVEVTNSWRDYVHGQYFVVWAGALGADPQQGVVVVADQEMTATTPLPQPIKTPTKHGKVRITAVNGSLLTLVADDGTMFVFDLTTRTFV